MKLILDFEQLSIKLFADGADLNTMVQMSEKTFIKGLTTNPTLMRKAGITNYKIFALEVLQTIKSKPISFEVFSDDIEEMITQGMEIASWGQNVNVKIPVTNTKGQSTAKAIKYLTRQGIPINVTAILTIDQVKRVLEAAEQTTNIYISVFAGRIADTGRDPIPMMRHCLEIMSGINSAELIWASPRELLNIVQANEIGCHIITSTPDILKKIELIGKDLEQYSLETVRMFRNDAVASGYKV